MPKISITMPKRIGMEVKHAHMDSTYSSYDVLCDSVARKFLATDPLPTDSLFKHNWGAGRDQDSSKFSASIDDGLAGRINHLAKDLGCAANDIYVSLIAKEYSITLDPEFYTPLAASHSRPPEISGSSSPKAARPSLVIVPQGPVSGGAEAYKNWINSFRGPQGKGR